MWLKVVFKTALKIDCPRIGVDEYNKLLKLSQSKLKLTIEDTLHPMIIPWECWLFELNLSVEGCGMQSNHVMAT